MIYVNHVQQNVSKNELIVCEKCGNYVFEKIEIFTFKKNTIANDIGTPAIRCIACQQVIVIS